MDANGRKNLLEMRASTWRWLAALRADTVEPGTGEESLSVQIDELYTKQDVNEKLNIAVTKYAVDVMLGDPTVLEDEATIDVIKNKVDYLFPEDLCFLKGCWWKDPEDNYSVQPPNDRRIMYSTDNIAPDSLDVLENGAPRYRRRLNGLVLDRTPDKDNPQGILVQYIKWFQYLATDDQYLESQYARILQEAVILSAAKTLSGSKGGSQMAILDSELKELEARLQGACKNGQTPPFMQMIPAYHPFQSRRGRRAR